MSEHSLESVDLDLQEKLREGKNLDQVFKYPPLSSETIPLRLVTLLLLIASSFPIAATEKFGWVSSFFPPL